MEEKQFKKLKWINGILILTLICLPLFLLWRFNVKIVFLNNDDLYIGELVSGITTGRPESHLVHIGYLTGLLLSRLYMVWSSIPWYGIFLFTMMYGSIAVAFSAMLLKLEKVWQKVLLTISAVYMICSFFFFSFNIRDKACVMVLPVFFYYRTGKSIKRKEDVSTGSGICFRFGCHYASFVRRGTYCVFRRRAERI